MPDQLDTPRFASDLSRVQGQVTDLSVEWCAIPDVNEPLGFLHSRSRIAAAATCGPGCPAMRAAFFARRRRIEALASNESTAPPS